MSTASIRELYKIIVQLSLSAIAVMPTSLQYKAMLCQKVMEIDMTEENFDSVISLSEEVRAELKWWM